MAKHFEIEDGDVVVGRTDLPPDVVLSVAYDDGYDRNYWNPPTPTPNLFQKVGTQMATLLFDHILMPRTTRIARKEARHDR